jgi:hypothetical protein
MQYRSKKDDIMIKLDYINQSEALRYMGYHSEDVAESIQTVVNECESALLGCINPGYTYKIFKINHTDKGVEIDGSNVILSGNSIRTHLEGCDGIILLAATLSGEADKTIRRYEITDMTKALAADALASAAIEQVCNAAEEEIKDSIEGKFMTWRFSPGYGDLPIELQPQLLALADAQRQIGLTATQNNILIPRKSVTAIIGLSDTPLPRKRQGCAICSMNKTCQFRKRGDHCGIN